MQKPPKWYLPVSIVALVWNLIGCAAYLGDVMSTPESIAQLAPGQQALLAARPSWAVAGTAVAVWFGAAGSLGLVLRKRWATPLLILSMLGVVVQDAWMFLMADAASQVGGGVVLFQLIVLAVAVALVLLARTAAARGWLA